MSETPQLDLDALYPADTPRYMFQAWFDCLHWALGEEGCVEAFRRDTGIGWRPGRSPIERAIDQATGAERHFFEAFIPWFNVNVWGPIDGPEPDA